VLEEHAFNFPETGTKIYVFSGIVGNEIHGTACFDFEETRKLSVEENLQK
jgi:hypothetical protein